MNNKIYAITSLVILSLAVNMNIVNGFWKPENAVPYPDCVEPIFDGTSVILHPNCGEVAMKANMEYYKGLGYEVFDTVRDECGDPMNNCGLLVIMSRGLEK
jgi:hypothetical protein